MRKIIAGYLLVILLVCNPVITCFASATASDAEWIGDDGELVASSSYADFDLDTDDLSGNLDYEEKVEALMSYSVMSLTDDGVSLASTEQVYSNLWSMDNTVSPDGCQVVPVYMSTDGTLKTGRAVKVSLFSSSSGYHYLGIDSSRVPDKPEDFKYMDRYLIQFGSPSLPSSGKYNMGFGTMITELGGLKADAIGFYTRKYIGNAKLQDAYSVLDHYDTAGGSMITYDTVVDFGNISYMEFRVYPDNWKSYWFPLYFRWAVVLEKVDSSTVADVTTAGGSYSSADAATDTAQNTSQIVQNTSEMNDTLKEIVQTISNQLAALWDQMYNLMHLKQLANDDKNTDRIVNKQAEQIENDNANTEKVTGAIEQHGNFIIEGLKSLFIPSDEFFKSYFDDLYEWFSDRFGFLSFPIDLLVMFSDLIISSDPVDCVLTLPGFEIMGEQLLVEQSFNLTDFLEEHFLVVLSALRMGSSVILIMAFVNLCGRKWDEVMMN